MPGALKTATGAPALGRLFRKKRRLLTYAIYNVILARRNQTKGGFGPCRASL